MTKAAPTPTPATDATPRESRRTVRQFILSGQFLPYLFFGAMGIAVLSVIGSIVFKAVHNDGLLPPPDTLDRYECTSGTTPFSFYYRHGLDRVQIKSQAGVLDGTVQQNQLDWGSFSDDATQLGFRPPKAITFEDAKSIRVNGTGTPEAVCVNTVQLSGRFRSN
jgi:hypothetical protein